MLGAPRLRVHEHAVAPGDVLQVPLGQRGPLVGSMGLVDEEDDASVEALGAQRFGGLRAGQARIYDGERGPAAPAGLLSHDDHRAPRGRTW